MTGMATSAGRGRLTATLLLVVLVLSAAIVTYPAWAGSHTNSYDSVDTSTNPNEIRWTSSTQYISARNHAIERWEFFRGADVDWRPDTATTINDLVFRDYSASDGFCGLYNHRPGQDFINFNINCLGTPDGGSAEDAVATQEAGHALGLGDHELPKWNGVVMDSCATCTDPRVTSPTQHDR